MKIIICEDNLIQRQFIQSEIMNYSSFYEPSIEIVLSASQPEEVLTYIASHRVDCYFLDIELNSSLDGLNLATKIRQTDPIANIIFITTYAEKLKLTFKYKIAALDFIVKDEPSKMSHELKEALQVAFQRYQQLGKTNNTGFFQVKIGELIKNIAFDDIYYFETSIQQVHKIVLHERNGFYEFYGKLNKLEKLDERFFRCHKSYLINLQLVKEIDKKNHLLLMSNKLSCPISLRMMKELKTKLNIH